MPTTEIHERLCSLQPRLTALSAICFDLDGTLYVQRSFRLAMAMRLLAKSAAHPRTAYQTFRVLSAYRRVQEALRENTTPGCSIAQEQIRLSCQMTNTNTEAVTACVTRWIEKEPLEILRRFIRSGLIEFLNRAKRRGIRLAVLSDYPAEAKLEALDLRAYFDVVASAQDTGIQCFKPNPAGLQYVLRTLGVPHDQALYVGDRVSVDAEAARRAAVPAAILTNRKPRGSDTWLSVRNFEELQTALAL